MYYIIVPTGQESRGDLSASRSITAIKLFWPSDQEVAATLDLLVKQLRIRGWEISPTKIQRTSTSVKFLRVQWYGACWESEEKNEK